MDLCSHNYDFGSSAELVFFVTSYCKFPYKYYFGSSAE